MQMPQIGSQRHHVSKHYPREQIFPFPPATVVCACMYVRACVCINVCMYVRM